MWKVIAIVTAPETKCDSLDEVGKLEGVGKVEELGNSLDAPREDRGVREGRGAWGLWQQTPACIYSMLIEILPSCELL